MYALEIIFLAFALSMDAFAVSISCGILLKKPVTAQYTRLALAFGFFQLAMTYIGYTLGSLGMNFSYSFSILQSTLNYFLFLLQNIVSVIVDFLNLINILPQENVITHFLNDFLSSTIHLTNTTCLQIIASFLLFWVGVKMAKDSLKKEEKKIPVKDPTKGFTLFMLAIATSIDALIVGLSLSLMNKNNLQSTHLDIISAISIIGLICTSISLIGMKLGTFLAKTNVIEQRAELCGGLTLIIIAFYSLF